jgi:hypothetical protein
MSPSLSLSAPRAVSVTLGVLPPCFDDGFFKGDLVFVEMIAGRSMAFVVCPDTAVARVAVLRAPFPLGSLPGA